MPILPTGPDPHKANIPTVIDFKTRQVRQVEKTETRGGKREPLPKFDIIITNYEKYNPPTAKKKTWVHIERLCPQELLDEGLDGFGIGLFLSFIALSSEGALVNQTLSGLARKFKTDYRTVQKALNKMQAIQTKKGPLIQVVDHPTEQVESKEEASKKQVATKEEASKDQVNLLDRPSDSAGSSAPIYSQAVRQSDSICSDQNPDTPETAQQASPESGFVFLLANGDEWELPADELANLKAEFPTVDTDAEFRKAVSWCRTRPKQRKTKAGMPKFLSSWLTRAMDPTKPKQQSLLPQSRNGAVDEAVERMSSDPRLQRFIKPKGGA